MVACSRHWCAGAQSAILGAPGSSTSRSALAWSKSSAGARSPKSSMKASSTPYTYGWVTSTSTSSGMPRIAATGTPA